ncbi:MAG: hypothetical protein A2033_19185 [Bacteroidetes bacterium GWA2_31_9]|nr:MAG: hypothetical protein A2033_19185 [Bacteroidetes bacterium GWA2_31_9]
MHNESKYFIGLIFGCPYNNELETCSLKEIRKMEIEDRIESFQRLTIEEQRNIIEKHFKCPNQKACNMGYNKNKKDE